MAVLVLKSEKISQTVQLTKKRWGINATSVIYGQKRQLMDFQMLFISSFLKQLVKNGKQMKKTTFCIFDVSVVQSEKNSCPAIYRPETPVVDLTCCFGVL